VTSPVPDPFASAKLGPLTLRNRVIKAATFEGVTREHVVSDRLIAFHRRIAAGGVGMTTVAYCAVSQEGCGTPNEIVLTRDTVPGLRTIADAVHAEGAAISAQIGHAGAVAAAARIKGVGPSPIFSPLAMRRTRAATLEDVARITREFADAARVVADGGFDAVEIHLGHGYLLSEFLSPKLNKRTDAYGGSLETRARFAREVVRAVREAVAESGDPPVPDAPAAASLDAVYAWNPVVIHRAAACAACRAALPRGSQAFMGLSDEADVPRTWLCATCREAL